jgi:hypothetical protein
MWRSNNGTDLGTPTEQLINFTTGTGGSLGFDYATDTWEGNTFSGNILSPTNRRFFTYKIKIIPEVGFENIAFNIVVKNFGNIVAQISGTGETETDLLFISSVLSTDFSYQFFVSASESFQYTAEIDMYKTVYTFPPLAIDTDYAFVGSGVNILIDTYNVSANLPKMKIIDFLRGLFQMFKLVVNQTTEEDIYVNTLNDYYAQGVLWDITRYVDFKSYDVNRGDILNEIDFRFEEPQTLLNVEFKRNTTEAYGDEYFKLVDENGDLLDGKKLEVKVPFEQIVYERLRDVNDNGLTAIMYGLATDLELKPVNPKAHIFYNNLNLVGDKPFKFINELGVTSTINTTLNKPSHTLNFFQVEYSTVFSEEFNEWDGSLITNTLYSNYYKNFIDSIFNIKRRNFSYKANLPLRILSLLKLNDILKIKENYFRIDNFTLNLLKSDSTLNLINSFDNTINPFNTNRTAIVTNGKLQRESIYVQGSSNFTFDIQDLGQGTDWISGTKDGNLIYFELDRNDTGYGRNVNIEITRDGKIINVNLNQQCDFVTFDYTTITFDNDITTWDNG